jgi:hypothetical protein
LPGTAISVATWRANLAQGLDGGVEAPRLAGQRPTAGLGLGVGLRADLLHQMGVGRIGLGGALGGLDPEDFEVGQRGPELLFRQSVALL